MTNHSPTYPAIDLDDANHTIHALNKDVARLKQQLQEMKMQAATPEFLSAWMPSKGETGAKKPSQSSAKIRQIGFTQAASPDVVTRLRGSWLGRIYRNRLKRYVLVRVTVQWAWRNGYPFYVNYISTYLLNRKVKRWRRLAKLSDFARTNSIPIHNILDAAIIASPTPKVFPASDQSYLDLPNDQYTFPEISVVCIKNATTYGGTNLILTADEVVSHDLYDFERDFTSEELHGRTLIDPKFRRIRWLLHDHAPEAIPMAATFVDACAQNYAHWLTEVLSRVVLFCADERFKGVPLVVNDGLHKNIMESLLLVAGPEREIITLPIGRALLVEELYLTSAAGYVPFDRRTNKLSGHSHGIFSPRAFELLQNQLGSLGQKTAEEAWPEKIFLRRNSGTRMVTNADELEKLLFTRGFVIVEPEKLTFLEQVQLFKNAKEIVAYTGAALSNAIFCRPETRVAILMAKHENMIYRYWANMLAPLQVSVFYVLGNIVRNQDLGIHGDFFVSPTDLVELLDAFEEK
jgi:capsular polysaccharide biosynthesis protein